METISNDDWETKFYKNVNENTNVVTKLLLSYKHPDTELLKLVIETAKNSRCEHLVLLKSGLNLPNQHILKWIFNMECDDIHIWLGALYWTLELGGCCIVHRVKNSKKDVNEFCYQFGFCWSRHKYGRFSIAIPERIEGDRMKFCGVFHYDPRYAYERRVYYRNDK